MKLLKSLFIATTIAVTQFSIAQTTCFSSDNNYIFEGASNANAIAKGDFNNDGKIDVVVVNSTGGTADPSLQRLYYVENTGNRTFAAPVAYQSGSRVMDVASGDVDGDGNLDVVLVNFNLNRIAVILGNGDGTFQTPVGYPTTILPMNLTLVDLNNDGLLDVVVGSNSGEINIFLNNLMTPGTYGTYQSVNTPGTFPSELVGGDFDGDGEMDIASSNGNGTVTVFKGDGNGNLTQDGNYLTSMNTADGIIAGDFNGNGDLDIAVISSDENKASVIINNGDGTYGTPTTHNVGTQPKAIAIIDYNKNGNLDLAIVNSDGNSLSILENNGSGSFLPNVDFISSGYPINLVVGDFDNDGNEDIIMSTQLNQALPVLFGDGNSGFVLGNIVNTGNTPYDITNNDFNGDGNIDFAVPNFDENTAEVYINDGLGNYSLLTTLITGNNPSAIVSGDINSSGEQDIIVANYMDGTVSIYINTGGNFSTPTTVSVNTNPIKVKLGDYDNDNNLDLFVLNENNQVTILKGNGTGGFTNPTTYSTGTTPKDIDVGDQNDNGFIDFVISCYGDNKVELFRGNGSTFTKTSYNVGTQPWGIAFVDLNGDGKLETVVANHGSNNVSVLPANATNGGYPPGSSNYSTQNTEPMGITTGDFNNDGLIDIAVTNKISEISTGTVTLLLNTGDFPPPLSEVILSYDNTFNVGINPTVIQSADINGNGSSDLLVVNQKSGHVSILENNTGDPIIIADGPTSICGSGSVTLTSTPASAYLWSNGETTQSIVVNTAGSYSVQTSSFGGCSGTSNVINVTLEPSPTLSFSGNNSICNGESTTITVSGADTYVWSDGLGTGNSKTLSPTSTITYSITGTNTSSGCTDEIDITITVNPSPDASFTGLNSTYCENSPNSVLIPTTHNSGTFSGPGIAGNTFNPSAAGPGTHIITYEVSVNGCLGTSTQSVNVTAGGIDGSFTTLNSEYCINDAAVTLVPVVSGGTFSGQGVSGNVFNPSNVPGGQIGSPITISYSVTSGGCSGNSSQIVTVVDETVPTFTHPGPICSGENFTLPTVSNNGISGTWAPAINNTATTTYTFTPAPSECAISTTLEVTVNPIPNVTVSPDISICEGNSTSLTASGAVSYYWSPATGLDATTGATVNANPTSTTTYTVTGTDVNGCENTAMVEVTVTNAITPTFTNPGPICTGGNFTLPTVSNNGINGTWSPAINNTATTTYTFTPDPSECAIPTTLEVTVNPIPNVSVSPDVNICPGASTTLTASGANSYVWSPTIGLDATTGATVNANPTSTTTYTVTGTDANGCENTAMVEVTVTSATTPTFTNPGPICSGENFILPTVSNNGISGTWAPAINNSATTTYTFTPAPSECADIITMTVNISPLPIVTVSPDIEICEGTSTTLTASGANIYSWSPATGIDATTGTTVSASPTSTTTYTVTGTDVNGCINTAEVEVVVNPLPIATILGDVDVCLNSNEPTVSFIGANGTAPYTFTYNIDGGANHTVTSIGNLATVTAPTHTQGTFVYNLISVEDNSPTQCSQSETGSVTITVTPLPTVTVSSDIEICDGTSTPLTASGANTYTWTPSTGLDATTGATVNASPTSTTTYTVTGTDGNGCTNTAQVEVVVNPIPTASISGNAEVCLGETEPIITFTGANGTAPYTFTYNIDGGANQTVTSIGNTATVTAPTNTQGTFTYNLVSVEDDSQTQCSQAQTGSITIIVNSQPTATISGTALVCLNDNAHTITFTGAGGTPPYTFTYNIDGGANQTVTSIGNTATITAPTNTLGIFTYNLVSVEDGSTSNCSQIQSGSATITVNPPPVVTVSSDTEICEGVSTSLTASGASLFAWSPATGLDATTGATVNASPTVTTTYTVTGTDGNGCTNTAQVEVVVNPLPIAGISGDTEVCVNASEPTITFIGANGTAPYTFTYNIDGGANQTVTSIGNTATITAPTNTQGTFTYNLVSVEDDSQTQCSQAQTGNVTIIVTPLPTASITGNAEVCLGATNPTITFTGANGTAPYTFTYNIDGGANQTVTSIGNTATVTAPTNTQGTFTYNLVSVEDGSISNCSQIQSESVTITVNPLPTVTVSSDIEICEGTSTPLTASGANSYTWTPTTGLDATTGTTVNANPTVTTTYTVTGTDGNGCTNTAQVEVVVNPIPTASISGNAEVCLGATDPTITFTGANGTAPYTFTYNIDGGANQTVTSIGNTETITAPTNTQGTFTYNLVSVEDDSQTQCSQAQTGSVTITVNLLPTVTVSSDIEICEGTSTPLTASGANSYTWTPATGLDATSGAMVNASPTVTTTYTVTGTDGNGCTNTAQVEVVVNPIPTASISGNAEVCFGETEPTITFTGANGTAPYTFTYNIDGGANQTVTSIGNTATITAPTNMQGTFTYNLVAVEDDSQTQCSQAQTGNVTIIVNPLPTASITGNAEVCLGATNPTITFTGANGTAPYTFTYNIDGGANQTVTSIGNTATVTAPTNTLGTFTYNLVSVEDGSISNCSQIQSESATITVNPLPTVTVNSDIEICEGTSTPLTASGANTYSWSPATGLDATTGATVNASPTVTTTYTVTGTDGNGCTNTAQVEVVVNPIPTASITGNAEVCLGATDPTITFTGMNGTAPYTFTYNIDGGPNQTLTSTGSTATITAPTNTQGTFIYNLVSVEDDSPTQCSQTQTGSVTITVTPLPTVTVSSDIEICVGTSTPLTASGANTYTWTPATGLDATTGATVNASPTVTTTYTVTGTDGNGCTNTAQVEVVVNPIPTASISGNAEVCLGENEPIIIFTGANGTAPYTFTYNINGGTNQTVTSIGNIAAITAPTNVDGIFTYNLVSIEDDSPTQCSQTQTGSITITVNPLPTATIAGVSEVCLNETSSITFTGTNGTAPYTFTYNIDGGANQTVTSTGNIATVMIPSNTEGSFTYNLVSVLDDSGCSQVQTGSVSLTVLPLPVITASPDVEICEGETTVIYANGGLSYTWSPATGLNVTTGFLVTAQPTSTTTYTVTGTDGNGCESTASVEVVVNSLPIATFTGLNNVYCIDESPTILTPVQNGGTFTGNGIVNGNEFDPSIAGVGIHNITYTVTNSENCQASSSQIVEVVLPTPTSIIGISTQYCSNDDLVALTGIPSGGVFSIDGSVITQLDPSLLPIGTHTLVYEVNDMNNCSSTTSVDFDIIQAPDATFSGLDAAYCIDEGPTAIIFNETGGVITGSGINNGVFNPADAGVGNHLITHTLTNVNGCTDAYSFVVTVSTPITSTISINGDILTADYSGPGITYQWYNCDSNAIIPGATAQDYQVEASGNYAVLINNGACQTQSECVRIFVTGLNDIVIDEKSIKVYPNPNNGKFKIETTEWLAIEVANAMGQIVYKGSQDKGINEVHLSQNIETGLYILKMTNKNGDAFYKNIIIRN